MFLKYLVSPWWNMLLLSRLSLQHRVNGKTSERSSISNWISVRGLGLGFRVMIWLGYRVGANFSVRF